VSGLAQGPQQPGVEVDSSLVVQDTGRCSTLASGMLPSSWAPCGRTCALAGSGPRHRRPTWTCWLVISAGDTLWTTGVRWLLYT
jgi:hypothetical protein